MSSLNTVNAFSPEWKVALLQMDQFIEIWPRVNSWLNPMSSVWHTSRLTRVCKAV
jgi:hypothetical protein